MKINGIYTVMTAAAEIDDFQFIKLFITLFTAKTA